MTICRTRFYLHRFNPFSSRVPFDTSPTGSFGRNGPHGESDWSDLGLLIVHRIIGAKFVHSTVLHHTSNAFSNRNVFLLDCPVPAWPLLILFADCLAGDWTSCRISRTPVVMTKSWAVQLGLDDHSTVRKECHPRDWIRVATVNRLIRIYFFALRLMIYSELHNKTSANKWTTTGRERREGEERERERERERKERARVKSKKGADGAEGWE